MELGLRMMLPPAAKTREAEPSWDSGLAGAPRRRGPGPGAGRAGQAPVVHREVQGGDPRRGGRVHEAGRGR